MNILIFEYITGGGLVGEVLPASLVAEGELMLNAIARDLSDINDVQVSVLRDYRLNTNESSSELSVTVHAVTEEYGHAENIKELESSIDALLIVAPESSGVLANLCKEYSHWDFLLLNSSTESIELASNKLNTYKHLTKFNVPQIPTYEIKNINLIKADKIIIKPMDGAGCENVYLINKKNKIDARVDLSAKNNYIVQPFVQGRHASLSLLCWDGECKILSANIQNITVNNECLELDGCLVNTLQRDIFKNFSADLIKSFTGLRGYVGVDVIITEDQILLVEINPRLTTSYAGLRAACGLNPAKLILEAFLIQGLPDFIIAGDSTASVEVKAEHAA